MTQARFLYFFNDRAHFRRFLWGLVILAVFAGMGVVLIPIAQAANFSCTATGNANGNLFDYDSLTNQVNYGDITGVDTLGTPSNTAIANSDPFVAGGACSKDLGIIGRVICFFRSTVGQIISQMYCQVQHWLQGPLSVMMTMFVAITGVAIMTGMMQLTVRDGALAMMKVALVWAFAMNATWGISVGYAFFMGLAEEGTNILLGSGGGSGGTLLTVPDQIIGTFLSFSATGAAGGGTPLNLTPVGGTAPDPRCLLWLFSLFMVVMIFLPMVAVFISTMILQYLWLYARALLGYLTALVLIGFLFVLSPIFISFALFQTTRPLFEQWLKYLTSYALQVVIVFAFLGILSMVPLGNFFKEIFGLLRPINMTGGGNNLTTPISFCSICDYTINNSVSLVTVPLNGPQNAPPITCVGGAGATGMPLTKLTQSSDLMNAIISQVVALWIIGNVMQEFVKNAPAWAMELTGRLPFAAALGSSGVGWTAGNSGLITYGGLDDGVDIFGRPSYDSQGNPTLGIESRSLQATAGLMGDMSGRGMIARAALGTLIMAKVGAFNGLLGGSASKSNSNSSSKSSGTTNGQTVAGGAPSSSGRSASSSMAAGYGGSVLQNASNQPASSVLASSANNAALLQGAVMPTSNNPGGAGNTPGVSRQSTATRFFAPASAALPSATATSQDAQQKQYMQASVNLENNYDQVQRAMLTVEKLKAAGVKGSAMDSALNVLNQANKQYQASWAAMVGSQQSALGIGPQTLISPQTSTSPQDKKAQGIVKGTQTADGSIVALENQADGNSALSILQLSGVLSQILQHVQLQASVQQYLLPSDQVKFAQDGLNQIYQQLSTADNMESMQDLLRQLHMVEQSLAGGVAPSMSTMYAQVGPSTPATAATAAKTSPMVATVATAAAVGAVGAVATTVAAAVLPGVGSQPAAAGIGATFAADRTAGLQANLSSVVAAMSDIPPGSQMLGAAALQNTAAAAAAAAKKKATVSMLASLQAAFPKKQLTDAQKKELQETGTLGATSAKDRTAGLQTNLTVERPPIITTLQKPDDRKQDGVGGASTQDRAYQLQTELSSYVGAGRAASLFSLAGESGTDALIRSFQAADRHDEAAREAAYSQFMHDMTNNLKGAKTPEQQRAFTQAAAALDNTTRSYNMMTGSASVSLARAYDEKAAHTSTVQDYQNFLSRTENIIQEAYQYNATDRYLAKERGGSGAVANIQDRSNDFTASLQQGKKSDGDQSGTGAVASIQDRANDFLATLKGTSYKSGLVLAENNLAASSFAPVSQQQHAPLSLEQLKELNPWVQQTFGAVGEGSHAHNQPTNVKLAQYLHQKLDPIGFLAETGGGSVQHRWYDMHDPERGVTLENPKYPTMQVSNWQEGFGLGDGSHTKLIWHGLNIVLTGMQPGVYSSNNSHSFHEFLTGDSMGTYGRWNTGLMFALTGYQQGGSTNHSTNLQAGLDGGNLGSGHGVHRGSLLNALSGAEVGKSSHSSTSIQFLFTGGNLGSGYTGGPFRASQNYFLSGIDEHTSSHSSSGLHTALIGRNLGTEHSSIWRGSLHNLASGMTESTGLAPYSGGLNTFLTGNFAKTASKFHSFSHYEFFFGRGPGESSAPHSTSFMDRLTLDQSHLYPSYVLNAKGLGSIGGLGSIQQIWFRPPGSGVTWQEGFADPTGKFILMQSSDGMGSGGLGSIQDRAYALHDRFTDETGKFTFMQKSDGHGEISAAGSARDNAYALHDRFRDETGKFTLVQASQGMGSIGIGSIQDNHYALHDRITDPTGKFNFVMESKNFGEGGATLAQDRYYSAHEERSKDASNPYPLMQASLGGGEIGASFAQHVWSNAPSMPIQNPWTVETQGYGEMGNMLWTTGQQRTEEGPPVSMEERVAQVEAQAAQAQQEKEQRQQQAAEMREKYYAMTGVRGEVSGLREKISEQINKSSSTSSSTTSDTKNA